MRLVRSVTLSAETAIFTFGPFRRNYDTVSWLLLNLISDAAGGLPQFVISITSNPAVTIADVNAGDLLGDVIHNVGTDDVTATIPDGVQTIPLDGRNLAGKYISVGVVAAGTLDGWIGVSP